MESNEKVLSEASRAYGVAGVDRLGSERDILGHAALAAELLQPFSKDLKARGYEPTGDLVNGKPLFEKPLELIERVQSIRSPNNVISVMLIGNHSAGKSSFINWYVGEKVQVASVAMETAGVTLVRRGKKRTMWRGKMTLGNFQNLERLGRLPGIVDHLSTEFCTAESAVDKDSMRSLELIDTPGLVDGNVRYPFDIDKALDEIAKEVSLILVFLDPIGKALCNRCMQAIERLSTLHNPKMHYILSKMDTVADAHDRQTVVSQVAQELQSRVKGTHALKILQIFIPDKKGEGVGLQSKQEKNRTDPPNQIGDLVALLRCIVDSRAQEVVVKALDDCKALQQAGGKILECNQKRQRHNMAVRALQLLLWVVLCGVLLAIGYWVLLNSLRADPLLVCASETGRFVHFQRLNGEKVSERIEGRRTIPCDFLRLYSGIPSMSLLVLLFILILYYIVFKVKRLAQITPENVRNVRAMLRHVETVTVPAAKSWRKILQQDSRDTNRD